MLSFILSLLYRLLYEFLMNAGGPQTAHRRTEAHMPGAWDSPSCIGHWCKEEGLTMKHLTPCRVLPCRRGRRVGVSSSKDGAG